MSKFWVIILKTQEISTVNGQKFIADKITMSSTRKFVRGDKNYATQSFYTWFPSSDCIILPFVKISSVGNWTISFSVKSTILLIGPWSNFWLFNKSTVHNSRLRIAPLESGSIFTSLTIGHVPTNVSNFEVLFSCSPFLMDLKALKKFISPTWQFPSNLLDLSPFASWVEVWSW